MLHQTIYVGICCYQMKRLIILLPIICLCKSGAALKKKIRAEYLIPFCITNYNVEKLGKQFLRILTL